MYRRFFKRLFDIFFSGLALIFLWPAILLIAILVRIKLGSPIMFKQKRPGKDEKIFMLHKFRTMTSETDKNGDLLKDEVRLTKFGRFLRATSLDELPEIWDIFRGKMSIIGPRPLLVEYLQYYTEDEKIRHKVKPGLTGLAQVSGRNTLSWEEKFKYDIFYVNNLRFWLDVKIFFKTIIKAVKREDIRVGDDYVMGKLSDRKVVKSVVLDGIIAKDEHSGVLISKFKEKDIENKVGWINNPMNNEFLHYELPLSVEKTLIWYNGIKDSKDRLDCTVEFNGTPVGIIGLLNISQANKDAEYYITIGEQQFKRQGIATCASILLIRYGFFELGLNSVHLNVDDDNISAKKLYEKLGFVMKKSFVQEFNGRKVPRCNYVVEKDVFVKRYPVHAENKYSSEVMP